MRANKDYSKAFIDCWFMHTCCSQKVRALYKPESLCMDFFRPMFLNVYALLRPVVSAVPLCPQTNFIVPLCPHVYIHTYVGTIFNSLYMS